MITIRNAREDESAILAEIGLRAWAVAVAPIGVSEDLTENARSAFQNFARSSWLSIIVAEFNGDIAGWAAREHFDEKISDFWVDPPFQKQGVGTALLEEVEQEVLRQGFDSVRLESHARNEDAVAFFEKRGYSVTWLSVTWSPKLDSDVQSIGLEKKLAGHVEDTYGPGI